MDQEFFDRFNRMWARDRELDAAVRREFETSMPSLWPQFQIVRDAEKIHPAFAEEEESPEEFGVDTMGGWRLFRWETDANVWFFLELCLKQTQFAIRLLWNSADQLPSGLDFVFADEPWRYPKAYCSIMVSKREKQWKVGTNPAYLPEIVVPRAIAEVKAFAEPIIANVLKRHGTPHSI